MQIVAVWNTAARLYLKNHNPTWIRDLARDIPKAIWKHEHVSNDPLLNACHLKIETDFQKFEELPHDYQYMHAPSHNQESPFPTQSSPNLVKLVSGWKEWAYTDGSCQIH